MTQYTIILWHDGQRWCAAFDDQHGRQGHGETPGDAVNDLLVYINPAAE